MIKSSNGSVDVQTYSCNLFGHVCFVILIAGIGQSQNQVKSQNIVLDSCHHHETLF